jgi:hypothetical protein
MAKPRFVQGTNSLEFSRGIRFPLAKPIEKVQVIDRSAANTLQVEDLGQTVKRFTLTFTSLPDADYNALVNWYENIASGAMNSFTYHDEDEATHTVKLLTSPLDFKETRHQRWSGDLLLEKVS